MDALPDILRCDDHEPRDFRDEETVKQFVRPIRWLSIDFYERRLCRLNVRLAPLEMFRTRRVHAFERAFPSIRVVATARRRFSSRRSARHFPLTWLT